MEAFPARFTTSAADTAVTGLPLAGNRTDPVPSFWHDLPSSRYCRTAVSLVELFASGANVCIPIGDRNIRVSYMQQLYSMLHARSCTA